ncbi:MAG: two-component regulator propeller domain-containing protein [Bacteriovoracaceae bacterium]|nr:histidine kinase [Bacteroidota bacterium]
MQKILILFFISIQLLAAQKLAFQRIGVAEGLPQSTVSDILQDREGFLWFGTWDGLVRYDGYSFVTFRSNPDDSATLTNNNIRGLFQDSSGYLWAMTQHGLNRFHPRTGTVKQFLPDSGNQLSMPSLNIYSMMQSKDGKIWLGTNDGFSMYDTVREQFTNYHVPGINVSLGNYLTIIGILVESDDILWMGSLDGLIRYDLRSKSFERYPYIGAGGRHYGVYEPVYDASGKLWCASANGKIVVFDPKRKYYSDPVYHNLPLLCEHTVHQCHLDQDGSLWITSYEKLMHIKKYVQVSNTKIVIQEYEEYQHDHADNTSLNAVSLLSFYKDHSGVIWVGSSSGLNKAVPQRKKFFSYGSTQQQIPSLVNEEVIAMLQSGNDSLWVGTREGLFLLKRRNTSYTVLQQYFNIPKTTIYSLFMDSEGTLLVGSREGLYVWNKRKKQFDHKNIYPSTPINHWRIYSFLPLDGALWIGTSDGMFRTTDKAYELFESIPFDSSESKIFPVLHLVKSSAAHAILVCTNGRGLFRYDTQMRAFTSHYSYTKGNLQSLSNPIIMYAYEDSNNTIWVATYGGGLDKIEHRNGKITYTHYQEKDGLSNNNLYCVLPDAYGNYWMSSNKGISKFDPRTKHFYNYNFQDGLPSNEYNQNAYYVHETGMMFFGGTNGFVEFYPAEIMVNATIPQIAVTDFRIFEKPRNELLQSKELDLSYNENYISFEFASLCYEAPNKNRYAYRLVGVTDRWTYTDDRRYASFANLDPGKYLFQVKGSNNDGVWNEAGVSISMTIQPPWWGTVFFRGASALFVIGMIIGGVWFTSQRKYQRRIAELQQQKALLVERQRTREQIARDLHDDVATTISGISLYAEMMRNRKKKHRTDLEEAVEKISMLATGAKQAMEEVVWSLSPQHDTLNNLVDRIGDVAAQWCNDHSLQCHLAFCIIPPGIIISEEVRKNVYLIFKEAMNNILKHSNATSVELLSWVEGDFFYLTIRDDGKGISRESGKKRTIGGNGMLNMETRSKSIGAELSVTSEKNKGTSIAVSVKIAQLRH